MATYINFHTHHLQQNGNFTLYNYIVKDGTETLPQQPFSAGIHPWYINDITAQQDLLKKITGDKNCLAIGETGLDHETKTPMEIQENVFRFQCDLALQQNKPVILHVVKSHFDVIKILNEKSLKKAVFHGYNNRYTILEKVLGHGFYVSIGAAVMNHQSPAASLLSEIPANRLFLETDDSHFSIEEIYAAAAEKRKTTVTALQQQISLNFNQLFI